MVEIYLVLKKNSSENDTKWSYGYIKCLVH